MTAIAAISDQSTMPLWPSWVWFVAAVAGLVLAFAWVLCRAADLREENTPTAPVADEEPAEKDMTPCHVTACPYPATIPAYVLSTGQLVWYCAGDFDTQAGHRRVRHAADLGGIA